ncbi:phage tail protein [Klebsiella pneumoniae]|uniref:phage tail protein n=1 Tax=Klebsiella pneumoniae TaxID=573 RepID=UPI003CFCE286
MQSLMPPVDAPNNEFSDGNPSLGTLGTIVRALFLNNVQDAIRSVQRELLSILAAANINPDGDSNTQVLQAINKIMVDSNMSVPYGIPLPWPTSTPPTGYLICNGASFSAATYPNLLQFIPGACYLIYGDKPSKGYRPLAVRCSVLKLTAIKRIPMEHQRPRLTWAQKPPAKTTSTITVGGPRCKNKVVATRKLVAMAVLDSGGPLCNPRIHTQFISAHMVTLSPLMRLVIQKPRLKTWHFIIL